MLEEKGSATRCSAFESGSQQYFVFMILRIDFFFAKTNKAY